MSIVLHLDQYCVYTHSINGDVFYVGKGKGTRPFSHIKRNTTWEAIAYGAGRFEVNIIAWYEYEISAYMAEMELIKKLEPAANMNCGGPGHPKTLINRGRGKYMPDVLNVARLTDYGRVSDEREFKHRLWKHLGITVKEEKWVVPEAWANAYEDYFFKPDPVYAKRKDKAPVSKIIDVK